MKLNNKGMTTVEIVVCFVLVTTISLSMYSLVSSFNAKREEESYRAKILVYKATLTKKIQDDFIKKGLMHAEISETNDPDNIKSYNVDCSFRDGSTRRLEIKVRHTKHELHPDNSYANKDDFYQIKYGPPDEMEIYELPDLGSVKGYCKQNIDSDLNAGCTFTPDNNPPSPYTAVVSQDLKINNVKLSISNEDNTVDETSHILNIYIGFYHPDLGNRYAINIVAPINYQ